MVTVLKQLADNDDLKLFDQFAAGFNYDSSLVLKNSQQQKDLCLLDLWYAIQEGKADQAAQAFLSLSQFNLNPATRFEIKVLKKYIIFAKKRAEHQPQLAPTIAKCWQRLYQLAEKLADAKLLNEAARYFYVFYFRQSKWHKALDNALFLLAQAKQQRQLAEIRQWADKAALIHFKLGNTDHNTEYYAIAQDPTKIFG